MEITQPCAYFGFDSVFIRHREVQASTTLQKRSVKKLFTVFQRLIGIIQRQMWFNLVPRLDKIG